MSHYRSAKVVIGSQFGDEGKGLLTDYLSDAITLVCRFNGGSQAGHTVLTPSERRHVFHHIGSGSFRGATTYLSQFFICNPLIFNKEMRELENNNVRPKVYVNPLCPVTTPWDMMINQITEEARGDNRNGSCGVGINETIVRSCFSDFTLYARNLDTRQLHYIQDKWVPQRLQSLKLNPSDQWVERLKSKKITEHFLTECQNFNQNIQLDDNMLSVWKGSIVFEGAQGLLLSQDHYWFPHVTHSHTGLTNIDILAKEAGIDHLDVNYVTRAYTTRHGNGPFPHEDKTLSYEDNTNVPNMWQGSLRFGLLDVDLLAETVANDLKKTDIPVSPRIIVTHLDQVRGDVSYVVNGQRQTGNAGNLVGAIMNNPHMRTGLSFGPTRNDVSL